MDYLWSPWRYRYIADISREKKADECPFCRIPAEQRDAENFLVHRAKYNFVILNIFPYVSGHLMVVPYRHLASLTDLTKAESDEMMDLTRTAYDALSREYRAMGCNIGMNVGQAAGAGIAEHIHMHVLPRWLGDVNFVTTIAETRVIPEELETTYRRLCPYFSASNV
jgi:ATP adenylyltransferase